MGTSLIALKDKTHFQVHLTAAEIQTLQSCPVISQACYRGDPSGVEKFCSQAYLSLGISAEIASNLPVTAVHLYNTNMPAENGNQTSNSLHGGRQIVAR